MKKEAGCFNLWTKGDGRRIIYARGQGTPTAVDVERLYEGTLEIANRWEGAPWSYLFYIDKLNPVSEEVSGKYIRMHEKFSAGGCRNVAYVDGHTYEVSVQSSRHTARSGAKDTEYQYFETEDEALSWLESAGF